MVTEVDILAQVYAYILSEQWDCNKLPENQNADPAARNDQDRLLTDEAEKPRSFTIIPEAMREN